MSLQLSQSLMTSLRSRLVASLPSPRLLLRPVKSPRLLLHPARSLRARLLSLRVLQQSHPNLLKGTSLNLLLVKNLVRSLSLPSSLLSQNLLPINRRNLLPATSLLHHPVIRSRPQLNRNPNHPHQRSLQLQRKKSIPAKNTCLTQSFTNAA